MSRFFLPAVYRYALLAIGSFMLAGPLHAGNQDHEQAPSIHVSGQAEVRSMPDEALVPMSVEARSKNLDDARREVTETVERFLQLTDELGIPRKQVDTAQLQIRPEYNWNNDTRKRRLIGYYVSRSLKVDLRDLSLLGALMERSADAGVNNTQGVNYNSSQREALRRQALRLAAENAKLDAEATAAGLGARVGKAIRVTANGPRHRPVPVAPLMLQRSSMAMDESSPAEQSYNPGEIVFSANVQIEFELLN